MTGPNGSKISAGAYSAASQVSSAASPLDWGDKCFLCSRTINIDTPPVEAREFWISPSNGGMYMCHSKCISEMNQAGGTPRQFHESRSQRGQEVVPQAPAEEIKPPVQEQGPGWLHFEKLADYNAYVKGNNIPDTTKVTVGTQLLQAGE